MVIAGREYYIWFCLKNSLFWDNYRFTCSSKKEHRDTTYPNQIPPMVTSCKTINVTTRVLISWVQNITLITRTPYDSFLQPYLVLFQSLLPKPIVNLWQPLICSPLPQLCHFKNVVWMESHSMWFLGIGIWIHHDCYPVINSFYCWTVFHGMNVPQFNHWRRDLGFWLFGINLQ